MAIEDKFIRNLNGLFNYSTDANPTTQADYMEAVKNWVRTEEAIVDSHLWQPTTNYSEGNQVKTPSLPSQCVLVCTTAGTSGNGEPDYTNVGVGDSVTDGTVEWLVSEAFMGTGGMMKGDLGIMGKDDRTFYLIHDTQTTYPNNDNIDVGWDYTNGDGAGIGLRSASNTDAGRFSIYAKNGTTSCALEGRPDKTLTWGGIDLTPQTYSIKNTSSDVNVASGSVKNLLSFSITKGTWLVQVVASFPNNSSGYRRLGISTDTSSVYMDRYSVQTTPAASGVPTQLTFTTCLRASGTSTYYLNAYQTSGSTLAVTAGVLLFRLSNTT